MPNIQNAVTSWLHLVTKDHATIDKLAILADFNQLRQFFSGAEPGLNKREMEARIRHAIGFTMTQLHLHLGALDALAEVMERDGSVRECVEAIKTFSKFSGYDGIKGDFELPRRKEFKEKVFRILE